MFLPLVEGITQAMIYVEFNFSVPSLIKPVLNIERDNIFPLSLRARLIDTLNTVSAFSFPGISTFHSSWLFIQSQYLTGYFRIEQCVGLYEKQV